MRAVISEGRREYVVRRERTRRTQEVVGRWGVAGLVSMVITTVQHLVNQ